MTPKPVHPSLVPRIPMRYTATISTVDGWWYRYRVDRLHGVFNPECSYSGHHTLKGARRAARRWVGRNTGPTEPVVIERHGGATGIANL